MSILQITTLREHRIRYTTVDVSSALVSITAIGLRFMVIASVAPASPSSVVPQASIVAISVLNNDSMTENTTVTVSIAADTSNGNTVVDSNNEVTYTPNLDLSGSDTFTYQITGGGKTSNTLMVMITVAPVDMNNDPTSAYFTVNVGAGASV